MTLTVLVVDDRVINREFLSTLLAYAGYRVVTAGDGAEALELARAWRPHLIISDILMPTMDGVQLVQSLRSDPGVAGIPVFFYTATYRLAEARELAQACGVSTIIPKPSEPEVILRAVADTIGEARASVAAHPAVVGIRSGARGQEAHVSHRLSSWVRDLTGPEEARATRAPPAARDPAGSFAQLHGLAMRLSALIELGLDVAARREPQELVELFCRAAQDIVNARYAGIVMLGEDGRRMRYLAVRGLDDAQVGAVRAAFDTGANVLKQLLGNGGPQRLRDLNGDPTQAGLPAAHPGFNSFLAVPVQSATRTYGLLYLAERLGADAFSEDDEQFALTVTWQLAPAYENLMLYRELRKYTDRLELEVAERRRATERLRESEERYRLLWETTTDAVILLDTDNCIQHVNAAACEIFGYQPAEIIGQDLAILQPARLREAHRRGLARHLRTGERALNWRGTETTALRRDGTEFPVEFAFSHLSIGPRPLFVAYMRDITERKAQRERIGRLTRIHAVLSGINSAIVRIHERDVLYADVCRVAVEAGGFSFAWIGAVDYAGGRVQPVAWCGDDPDQLRVVRTRMSLHAEGTDDPGLIARAVLEKRPMISNDVSYDTRVRFRRELQRRGVRSVAVLPLRVAQEVVAVLALSALEAGTFNDEEMKLLGELAGDISFGLQYIDKIERLDYLAYYDALTGLANSTLFHDRLTQFLHGAKSDKELIAVLILDLDHFTQLNDTLGRHVCDRVLQTAANRFGTAIPEPFSLARIGSDTFAVAVPGLRSGADAAAVLHARMLRALHEPMRIDSHEIRVSARVGIALFPDDGTTAAALFKNAEAALGAARTSGERYLYYAPEINARVADKLALESRLRRAAEQRQFVLHYQPKIGARDGRVIGLEALIRWNDPVGGLLLPENFIDMLEETGLILDVGRWALEQALSDYRRWRDAGLRPPRIAINVSPLELRQLGFADNVRTALDAGAVGPQALEIELTESLIMENIDANIETLRRINRAGVRIAVDDFGTGYSSLRYLAKLPVDALKIDRSFIVTMVNDQDSMTIVSTIISLSHSLGLRVVAEGVDSAAQALVLQQLGCDEMQGHLYSKALTPEQVEVILPIGSVTPRR